MENNCSTCAYAIWAYDAHDYGGKRWHWDGCHKGHEDQEEEDCADWKEWQSDED